MNAVHVQAAARFLAETSLELTAPEVVECACVRCGHLMRFPVVVHERDAETMAKLIELGETWLRMKGVTGNMVADIRARCAIELARLNSGGKPR